MGMMMLSLLNMIPKNITHFTTQNKKRVDNENWGYFLHYFKQLDPLNSLNTLEHYVSQEASIVGGLKFDRWTRMSTPAPAMSKRL